MRVALVHDYLNQRGGAERVFAHIANAYPEAPVYTSLFDPRTTGDLIAPERVRTSWLQQIPLGRRYFRFLAPLYPAVFESFDLSAYDVVVSSTTAWAKGVHVRPDAVHVCYIHTVSRFVFDYDRYVGGFGAGGFARRVVRGLTNWDLRAAARPTAYIANSHNVAARVRRYYGREAEVLPCPVDVDRFRVGSGSGDYAVVASRLLPYKRIDLAIDACRLAGIPLKIIGSGPAEGELRRRAAGSTTEFLGWLDDARVAQMIGEARVVILPGEEDFGLVPLEAAASGTPTIAYAAGGALETLVAGETGAFFAEPTPESLAMALSVFRRADFDPHRLRAHAQCFRPERFIERLRVLVEKISSDGTRNIK
ncbi:MAG TPA: glycosyltransferase [Candidatus Acidoferrales bacterium]|nr:glycosyltransferase [Candidatus Acidoferrales bacterium]